ncbi:sigma-70 family RNA polymerase sigma factor [Chitinophaga cymbidii]|uniref:RNA polymerase sigma factor n=1 Tax=Chitinophaga cymbidii TaxID=1096750 RepID=A0A512RIL8_9BACT|nr:sigma-70 family RNA polymerase sigma factor [Chitinophaga cymbidii]GEP95524.1 RNA polymerase sigma factor [Chitinophaga cymbidii]
MAGQTKAIPIQLSDEELILRILTGEKRLFEQLIRKYNQRLYRIGMSILESEPEVEDAMQTTYINAYEHLSGFEGRSSFGTWLTRIMLNQCYGQKRKAAYRLSHHVQLANSADMNTPANEIVNKELGRVLEHAITRLPEKYRLVFVLRELEELSVREAAGVLGINETNIKVRLNRAKIMLRQNLGEYMKDQVYGFHLSKCDVIVSKVMRHLQLV